MNKASCSVEPLSPTSPKGQELAFRLTSVLAQLESEIDAKRVTELAEPIKVPAAA